MQTRPRLRMLHTSDVHLGSYDHGSSEQLLQRREHSEEMFRRVIDVGLRERADFLVIAGDFFDNARVHDDTLRFAAEQIARLERPVIIVPGNHDHIGPQSVYDRFDLTAIAQNLIITRAIDGETVVLSPLGAEVWGRSHAEHDPDFSPFVDAPGRGDAPWHIGVGHGHYLHPQTGQHPSFHIREQHLACLDYDYIALGHWEQQTRVAAGERLAAYSGAPDGLASVMGHSGRVLLVDFHPSGDVRLSSHPLREPGPPIDHDEIPLLRGI